MSINYDKLNTYMAASGAFSPGAAPQDVFTISGSATANIYVLRMGISSVQTTAGINDWYIAKRSTANSGGVAVASTAVSFQSGQSDATASIASYTTTPSSDGSLIGYVWSGWASAPAPATTTEDVSTFIINFETAIGGPIALLSAADSLGFNFLGNALPTGLSVSAWVLWVEGPKS